MTSHYLKQITLLAKRLLLCYAFYFVSRLVFFLGNLSYFKEVGPVDFLADSFFGLRFDSFSIVVASSVFILFSLLPFRFFYKAWYQKTLLWLWVLPNSIFLAFNFIDVGYYAFIKKRSSAEIFAQAGGQSDLMKLIPQFVADFWWILILYIASVWLMVFFFKRIKIQIPETLPAWSFKSALTVLLLFSFCIGLGILGARGGLQRVPIDVVNAGAVTGPEEIPIVLNTPFTIIKSMEQKSLPEYQYYSNQQLVSFFDPVHHYKDSVFKKQNVVVLILESFSKEYTKLGRTQSITPFLDSLMDHSLVFSNGFSNGTKSIEGIPAVLASLPTLMDNPFINSQYATNRQTSFASLLKEEGYSTAFFHGGINGTMNFTDWAPAAGYDRYFGRDEYGDDKDFDGFWGIFDEPFLQYACKTMSTFKQPFHGAVFTLSSHHPYLIPEKYKGRFPKTKLENSESVGYADYALRRFFETAKKEAWYNNTLFILTADHASISEHPFFSNPVGCLTIPILFFKPDGSLKGTHEGAFSQVDILPSAMSLLGYNKPFFAFGKNCFEENARGNAYFYINGTYFLCEDSMAYTCIENKINCTYNYRRDSLLKNTLTNIDTKRDSLYTARFRAMIQFYNHTLINNLSSLK